MPIDERRHYPCSVCGSGKFRTVHRFGIFSSRQDVAVCRECGIVCLNPRWDEQRYERYYRKEYYSAYQPRTICQTDAGDIIPGDRSVHIFNAVSPFAGKEARILEIGCGNGDNLVPFLQYGYTNLTGIEPSPECCDVLRQRGITAVNGTLSSILQNEYSRERYDCIILSHVLEHFVHPEQELSAMLRLLEPSGFIFILVPDFYGFSRTFRQFTTPHTFYFSQTTLERLLLSCGYAVTEYCKAQPGEIALAAASFSCDKSRGGSLNHGEYANVISHLKSHKLHYYRVKTMRILQGFAGFFIVKLMSEERWVALRELLPGFLFGRGKKHAA